jgi:hypothetical protein
MALPWKVRRARFLTAARERGEAWLRLSLTGMSMKDAARWRSARSMPDLGELVIAWLNGDITQTPGHCGPPESETIPLVDVLTVINRGGLVTDCSQLAESRPGDTWNTWVDGFASDDTLARLREAAAGTPLILTACRGRVHEHRRMPHLARCCWAELVDFWAEKCPAVADGLEDSWLVSVEDPEPGRNDLLWPVLAAALT